MGYVIGFPLGSFLVLHHHRKDWMDDTVMYKYGMLMAGYRHDVFYWEIVITIRKASIIAISVFLSSYGADVQVFVGILILVIFMGFHLHINPYEIDSLNRLETWALGVEFVTLYFGLIYYWDKLGGQHMSFVDSIANGNSSGYLTLGLIVMQVVYFCVAVEVLFDQYVRRAGAETCVGRCIRCKCCDEGISRICSHSYGYRGEGGVAVDEADDEWVDESLEDAAKRGGMRMRHRKSEYNANTRKTKVAPTKSIRRGRSIANRMRQKSVKVKKLDINDHLGKISKRKKLRGIKLFRNTARIMTGSFTRVEDSIRKKYEANRYRLKRHFKFAVRHRSMHKSFKEGEALTAKNELMKAISAETSAAAIDDLVATIAATKDSFSVSVTKMTKETLQLAENRLYSMRAELVADVKKQLSIVQKKNLNEVGAALPNFEKAITTLASADVPNQEALIMKGLQVMSEIQEIVELRDHLLKMDRTAITILVGMKNPPVVVARVMEAAAIMLGMDIPKRRGVSGSNPKKEKGLSEWVIVRKWLQKQGSKLFGLVKEFDSGEMTDTQISEASELLSECTFAEANRASEAAGLFYAFCSGMLFDVKNRLGEKGFEDGNHALESLLAQETEAESLRTLEDSELPVEGKSGDVESQQNETKSTPENVFEIEVDNDDDDDDGIDGSPNAQNLSNPELHMQKPVAEAFSDWESKEGSGVGIMSSSKMEGEDNTTIKYDESPEGSKGNSSIDDPTHTITDAKDLKKLRSWRNSADETKQNAGDTF